MWALTNVYTFCNSHPVKILIISVTARSPIVPLLHKSTPHTLHLPSIVVVVQFLSHVWLFVTPWTVGCQVPLSSTISQSLLKLIPLNWCCHPIISSTVSSSSCPQSFPASGCFPKSQLFTSRGQSIGTSASTSVLPVNIQGWFSLGLSGFISSKSKGLSRVFSSTTVQKHQFFGTQPSLWSNSHIYTWLLEKP